MATDGPWSSPLGRDTGFGFLDGSLESPRNSHPQLVLNTPESSMLRTLREELRRCEDFTFSVAFVSPRAIALLKQEFVDFRGRGVIVTSDYLGFNSPQAFRELRNLSGLGIEARLHKGAGYHPKGYIFGQPDRVTAILGSSNLTESAIASNHEWNLRVTASRSSDLAHQFHALVAGQIDESVLLTEEWIDRYAEQYESRGADGYRQPGRVPFDDESVLERTFGSGLPIDLKPNQMQKEALGAINAVRTEGKNRAVVISATGTGKTILSAFDVHAANPDRLLFVVHREQILDRAIAEFQRVLDAPASDFGKLTGTSKNFDSRYTFATVQTLSRPDVLEQFDASAFGYILIDEVHRAGAESYSRVIDYFRPDFLLGMTATPERSDGINIYELFDYNVPYEIRLGRALENDMLCPFHYYGVADIEFDDGTTTSDSTDLGRLASRVRVEHVLGALGTYGQAGVAPRGLVFCSRKDEAHALASELSRSSLRGRPLRAVALTGDDSIERRNTVVAQLEAGEIDYILTVDIFNEGVDIPSVNQVVMLRQTKSAIVFVQQLGRGLRKHPGKDYVVVVDFIGNYANNYLIPIALFGDESLNKESLRKSLASAEEAGVLPGLSSVRFDPISQERVLRSIAETRLDSMSNLKYALETLRNRLGAAPALHDFWRFESVDPVLLATRLENYPALVERLLHVRSGLTPVEHRYLAFLSNDALAAKRPHELLAIQALLGAGASTVAQLRGSLAAAGAHATVRDLEAMLRVLSLEFHTQNHRDKFEHAIVQRNGDDIKLSEGFARAYEGSSRFAFAVDDVLRTGLELIGDRYAIDVPFTPGRQYSRRDACRLLGWDNDVSSTIYGYKVDRETATCPIFVTYHKGDSITASTAYQDELIDRSTMRWFTRSKRTLASGEVAAIVGNEVAIHVFSKKSDADGSDFYYLGKATSSDAEQTTMPDDSGKELSVVRMTLTFDQPIDAGVFDYFHPVVMG